MNNYYYYDGKAQQGPFSASALKVLRDRLAITDNTPICEAGKAEWTTYGEYSFLIRQQAQTELSITQHQQKAQTASARRKPSTIRNQRASILLTACVFVFIGLAAIQVISGLMSFRFGDPVLGWSLVLASSAYILPIAVAYALRQILECIVKN